MALYDMYRSYEAVFIFTVMYYRVLSDGFMISCDMQQSMGLFIRVTDMDACFARYSWSHHLSQPFRLYMDTIISL